MRETNTGDLGAGQDVILESLHVLCTKVDKIMSYLEGQNGTPGMKIRMDRLEQAESRRSWTVRAVLVAVLGLLTKVVVDVVGSSK